MTTTEATKGIFRILFTQSQRNPEGACLTWEKAALTFQDFEVPALGKLWEVVGDFLQKGQSLDLLAIEAKAKAVPEIANGGGGKLISETLMGDAPSRHIAPEYARIISEASLRRRSINLLRDVAMGVKDSKRDITEVLAQGNDAFQALTQRVQSLTTSEKLALDFCDLAEMTLKGHKTACIPSGITALDRVVGGLQSGVLTLLGAFPGVGKSALLATVLWNLAEAGVKTGFFSLEDEKMWIAKRWFSRRTGVPLFNFSTFQLTNFQMEAMAEGGGDVYRMLSQVVIDDRPGLSPADVCASAKDMILNHGCKVIIVDHLGEIRLSRSERYDLDITDALADLRDIAKRYSVPVVVASHVRRRQGLTLEDAPALTDFANSSAPERMARVALGLSKIPGGIRCSILKQTNGPSGVEVGLKLLTHAAMISSKEEISVPEKNHV
jgi:replicative DNA helicase